LPLPLDGLTFIQLSLLEADHEQPLRVLMRAEPSPPFVENSRLPGSTE
jgi:hypothetical protein